MEIRLLTSKEYRLKYSVKRSTFYDRLKKNKIVALKVSPVKLWLLPQPYKVWSSATGEAM